MAKITEILITVPLTEIQIEDIRKLSDNLHITHLPTDDLAIIPIEIWEPIEVLFTDTIFPEEDQAPHLKWIQYFSEKPDLSTQNKLSLRKNLKLTTMEGINAIQVAEHAVGLLLALSRKLPDLFNLQENNEWLNNRPISYQPNDLFGSTIGIVGYNKIGRQIAHILKGFGCSILASKKNVMHPTDESYTPEGTGDPEGNIFTRLYPQQAIRSMFKECDSVIITTPYTKMTQNLIGENQLEALKPGSMLVDVSEGGVVDLEALTNLMADNQIGGAALDVFPDQPLPADNLLWSLPNVIISPNVSTYSKNHIHRKLDLFSKNLLQYLDGQNLFNQINLGKGQ